MASVAWILGASIGLLVFIGEQLLNPEGTGFAHPLRVLILSILGVVVSWVGGYVALLYGGYANWNWAMADRIARDRGWLDLPWEYSVGEQRKYNGRSFLARKAQSWARPRDPANELAPIFIVYARVAMGTGAFHIGLMIWSAVVLAKIVSNG